MILARGENLDFCFFNLHINNFNFVQNIDTFLLEVISFALNVNWEGLVGSWNAFNYRFMIYFYIAHLSSHRPSWRPAWPAEACPWSPPRCTPPCWPCCGPWSRTQSAAPRGTAGCAAHRQALITLIMMRVNNQNLLNLAEIFPCRRVFRPLEHSLPEIRINILSWWQCWSEKTLLMEGGKKKQNINAGLPHLHSAVVIR